MRSLPAPRESRSRRIYLIYQNILLFFLKGYKVRNVNTELKQAGNLSRFKSKGKHYSRRTFMRVPGGKATANFVEMMNAIGAGWGWMFSIPLKFGARSKVNLKFKI